MTKHDPFTLVLGSTGKTGSRVVTALINRGLPVRSAGRQRKLGETGLYLGIVCDTNELVDAAYAAAIKAGGTDEGEPADRTYFAPGYYAANVADFDGNRLEFVHKAWNPSGSDVGRYPNIDCLRLIKRARISDLATCGIVRAMSDLAPIADSGCGAFMSTRPRGAGSHDCGHKCS
jgi:hypothetical protein